MTEYSDWAGAAQAKATIAELQAEIARLRKVADCAMASYAQSRREFIRGEIDDLDELEDALKAAGYPVWDNQPVP